MLLMNGTVLEMDRVGHLFIYFENISLSLRPYFLFILFFCSLCCCWDTAIYPLRENKHKHINIYQPTQQMSSNYTTFCKISFSNTHTCALCPQTANEPKLKHSSFRVSQKAKPGAVQRIKRVSHLEKSCKRRLLLLKLFISIFRLLFHISVRSELVIAVKPASAAASACRVLMDLKKKIFLTTKSNRFKGQVLDQITLLIRNINNYEACEICRHQVVVVQNATDLNRTLLLNKKAFEKMQFLLWAAVETGRSTDEYLCRWTRINMNINTVLRKTDELITVINHSKLDSFLSTNTLECTVKFKWLRPGDVLRPPIAAPGYRLCGSVLCSRTGWRRQKAQG